MTEDTIYYATNRNHIGKDRWHPDSYGTDFSNDGRENLRFGKVTIRFDDNKVNRYLDEDIDNMGKGNGEGLASYMTDQAETAKIVAFEEKKIDPKIPDDKQDINKFGSQQLFHELKDIMMKSTDVLVYIHGFSVSWHSAVGSAFSLLKMLNRNGAGDTNQKVMVVLFTWPADGSKFPYRAYAADRADARDSGYAFGRGMLKLRDYLKVLRNAAREAGETLCEQDIHLLCHSMGNYVLQNTLQRMQEHTIGNTLPRIFDHIFLCAPDVDDNALEEVQPMGRLHEIARSISVYYNRGDTALLISDVTKSNPDRLGTNGAAQPYRLHNKVHQIDCSPVVKGLVEHSYYMSGSVNMDVRQSMDGIPHDSTRRNRETTYELPNLWRMKKV